MKNLYFVLVFLLASLSVRAQISDPTRATLDNIFAPLDKNQVPTGRLAEFATPLVPLDVFNGVLTDSSRTTPDGFRYIYATLYSAQVSGIALPTLADLNNRVTTAEAQAGPNIIPLLVQRIDYASVRSDAFNTNLLRYQNGQVSDVAGRSQSPYQVRTLFAAAPTRANAALGSVAFSIPSLLYTQSGGSGVNAQYVDSGDGQGYQATSWGQTLIANYTTAGTKRVKVRFIYNDGSSYESHFDIEITGINNSTITSAGGVQPLGVLDFRVNPIAGVRAGGTVHVTPGNGHSAIIKPFIVAEGYDPSKTIPMFVSNYTDVNFSNAIDSPTRNFYFKSQLLNAGYDIIFIDYDDGTDDILLNAALFKEVINQVNTRKASSEQNVILGISMGGLVARYGLADMEKSVPGSTQTRLLILQDSPQRGANTPLGLQALVRQSYINFGSFTLFDINKALFQLNNLIDRPASQQLLLYRATDASSGCAYNTFLDNTYRPKITFPAGQNPPYQIIATSNGSQCGTALFAPYTELARGDGNIFLSPFPWIVRTRYYAQVIVNAIPANGQANRLSTLQLYSIIRLFGFINIRNNFVREDYNCPAGLLAVDGVAGGTQYLGRRLPAALPTTAGIGFSFNPFFAANASYTLQREFCFVSTASALDLNEFNQSALQGKNINGVSSVSYSRINAFIAQEPFLDPRGGTYSNEFHTTFNARNSEWMFDVMENKPFANVYCSSECSVPPTIISTLPAGYPLCNGRSATFSISNLAVGTPVTWSATPTSLFTTTTGSGSTFTTSQASGQRGNGTITATVGACQTQVSTTVAVGGASPIGRIIYNGITKPLQGTNFVPSNTSIVVYLDQPGSFTFTSNNPSVPLRSNSNSTSFYIQTTGTNSTRADITATSTDASSCLSGTYFFIAASYYSFAPNPVSSELTVTDESVYPASSSAEPFEAELYDNYGKKVKTKKSEQGKAIIDTRDLPNGLYNLRVGKGKNALSEHVEIAH